MSTGDDAQDTTLLSAALAWAERGWHVFPCAAGRKQPAVRGNWQDLATTDPARIRQWWRTGAYNIGIACGPSRLVVIDLDVADHNPSDRDGAGGLSSGARTFSDLCRQRSQMVPASTFTVRTPSGGYHLYFIAPTSSVRNSVGRLGPLIDVRGAGGYVVAAGSRVNGRPYTVMNAASPAPFPVWITAELRGSDLRSAPCADTRAMRIGDGDAYAMAALRDEGRRVATALEHTRNDTLNRAAFNLGQLVGAGLLTSETVSVALAEAAALAGLPASEASRTIGSGLTAGTRIPRQLEHRNPTPHSAAQDGRSARRASRDAAADSAESRRGARTQARSTPPSAVGLVPPLPSARNSGARGPVPRL